MHKDRFIEVLLPLPIDKTFHYRVPERSGQQHISRVRVKVPFGRKTLSGYSVGEVPVPEVPGIRDVTSFIDAEPVISDEMLALAGWISDKYMCSAGEALGTIAPLSLLPPKRAASKKEGGAKTPPAPSAWPSLKPGQAAALDTISKSLEAKRHACFLLHGVTGSGKTEVYLSAIKKTIDAGRSAVFLLPEISLTPQFINIVQSRFPGIVGVWHSRLSKGQKYAVWAKARKGDIKIMLGARSALFAPFSDPGLIIIDEEHEPSYKQEQKPAYQTRDAALERARLNNAALILGSATPSLESYFKAKSGEFELIELAQRVDDRPLPRVKIVDMKQRAYRSKILSSDLINSITKILAKREQAIIFLNRRGFAPGVMCTRCGQVWECPSCSVSLVYHKQTSDLLCHYCDFRQEWPGICPSCKDTGISIFGVGTQKVEEEIKRLFPQGRIFRLDKDTASKKGVYEKTYKDFKSEEFDILLGTQMIAKGFDFPRVTLVGVIDADTALYIPDFRAPERTFQLLTQVSGRCGRSDLGGEVIVQTKRPDHYALVAAQGHDYKKFYLEEIESRRLLGYPPFSGLANIKFRGKSEEKVKAAACDTEKKLCEYRKISGAGFEMLGPSASPRAKLHGLFRWQILLKGEKDGLLRTVKECLSGLSLKGAQVSIDIDPQTTI